MCYLQSSNCLCQSSFLSYQKRNLNKRVNILNKSFYSLITIILKQKYYNICCKTKFTRLLI